MGSGFFGAGFFAAAAGFGGFGSCFGRCEDGFVVVGIVGVISIIVVAVVAVIAVSKAGAGVIVVEIEIEIIIEIVIVIEIEAFAEFDFGVLAGIKIEFVFIVLIVIVVVFESGVADDGFGGDAHIFATASWSFIVVGFDEDNKPCAYASGYPKERKLPVDGKLDFAITAGYYQMKTPKRWIIHAWGHYKE